MRRSRVLGAFVASLALGGCAGPPNPADVVDTAPALDGALGPDATAPDAVTDGATVPDDAAADVAADDAFRPGPHEPFLQLPDQGGPRISHPALVTVTFAGDTRRAELEAYAAWLVGSRWLTAVGADYGVGSGTVGGTAQLPDAPPAEITTDEVATLLATHILDGSVQRPPGGLASAIYLVYFPATTAILHTACGRTARSCDSFGGLHSGGHALGLNFAFAVLPTCGTTLPGQTLVEVIEGVASHEIIEAASDPDPLGAAAWQLRYDATDPWTANHLLGCAVENADLCELPTQVVREDGHLVRRSWSNAAAAAGGDPCVPLDPASPYFNTTATPTTVQHVAPGGSVDFELHGWSVAPVPDWTVSVTLRPTAGAVLNVTPTLSARTLNNGGTATLHIAVPADAAPGTSTTLLLTSRRAPNTHYSLLAVATP